jgi:hypothetical protein
LDEVLAGLKTSVSSLNIEDSINFILWYDMYAGHFLFGPEFDQFESPEPSRFNRGDKVFVEFGHNLDKELSLPHPAIVLYNFKYSIVVAPTLSDDGNVFGPDILPSLIKVPGDGAIFPNDTIINLSQLTTISKNRVLNNQNRNVSNYNVPDYIIDELNLHMPIKLSYGLDLLTVIDYRLTNLLHRPLLKEYTTLLEENVSLKKELEDLKKVPN